MNFQFHDYLPGHRTRDAILTLALLFMLGCGSNNSTDAGNVTPPTDDNNASPPPGSGLPIPLDPHPQPTVILSESNGLTAASAIYRAERLLTRFLQLSIELDAAIPEGASTSVAALSLGNSFCSSGDGAAQAADSSFAGAQQSAQVGLKDCVSGLQSISGEISLAHFDDDGTDWLIVEPRDVTMQFNDESVEISSGSFRMTQTAGGDLTAIGTSLSFNMAGYDMTIAPFDSSIMLDDSKLPASQHSISLSSELIGGLIFSKPSAPVVLGEDGLALSGGNTLRGMGPAVIEWSAGTTFNADSTADSTTDVRDGDTRTLLESTWTDFLSAF